MIYSNNALIYIHPVTSKKFIVGDVVIQNKKTKYRKTNKGLIFADKIEIDHLKLVGKFDYNQAVELIQLRHDEFDNKVRKLQKK